MLKPRQLLPALLAVCVAGFAAGVIYLFHLRFNAGDIYPPYSSLRADPLGAKALYESLQSLPGISARRFFQASSKLQGGPQRVLFLAGTAEEALENMPESDFKTLQAFMFSGGRVVVALSPVLQSREFRRADTNRTALAPPPERPGTRSNRRVPERESDEPPAKTVSLPDKTGLRVAYDNLFLDGDGVGHSELASAGETNEGLPPLISWHSAAYFDALDPAWRTIYRRKKHPVILERSFGPGSLVLASDSYFVSNEALRRERHAELLAWLVGRHREIIFDETHLGVEERPGVSGLMRQYHLQGALLALLLVAGLFIWKNGAPLVPPPPEEPAGAGGALVEGREATAGFAGLLRRSIPPSEIVLTSFAEWKAACARRPRAAERLPEIERIIAAEQARTPGSRRPVETYQAIHRILTERK